MEPSQPIPVPLTAEQRRFIQRQIDSGRFATPEEVLREGLRMLEDWEDFIAANRDDLRRKIEEGAAAAERGEFIDGEAAMERWKNRDEAAKQRQQNAPHQHKRPA